MMSAELGEAAPHAHAHGASSHLKETRLLLYLTLERTIRRVQIYLTTNLFKVHISLF